MIPVDHAHVRIAAQSHAGQSGKNNEDRFSVTAYQLSAADPTPALLALVSDGIGGHLAGEVAAELAVGTITQVVAHGDPQHPVELLKSAVVQASEAIREQAESQQGQQGMGATCACVWLIGERLYTASVGDSRIYLVRKNTIHQLTTDHTWVQEAVEHGALTPEQARDHPNVHVIRRYLGSKHTVIPDTRLRLHARDTDLLAERNQGTRLKSGDRLLLCTDGLTDLVNDQEILSALSTSGLEDAVHYLVELANHRGGHDNITIVGLEIPTGEPATTSAQVRRILVYSCIGALLIIVVALATILFLISYFRNPDSSLALLILPIEALTHLLPFN